MNPRQIEQLIQEGLALQRSGKLVEAGAVFARLRREVPRNVDAWQLAGNVALLLGDAAGAAELYRHAHRLAPRSAVVATCLGIAEMARGNLPAAEAQLRAALGLDPKNGEIASQLASVLHQRGRHREALLFHQKAVTLKPRSAQAWHGYGATLTFLNRAVEALDCERRAVAADSAYLPARHGFAVALQKCHRVREAVAEFDAILARHPEMLEVHSHRLLALHYLSGVSPEELYRAHKQYGVQAEAGVKPANFPNVADPDRKLRLAVFSADLRNHAVARFLLPLLQHLDHASFDLLFYSATPEPDSVTDEFRALAAVWRDVSSQVNSVVEPQVRSDAPDIALDLGGHTGTANLALFARRVAPIQITYLGYPNTTGLMAMDYRLVDARTDPVGAADQLHTEKLVRFSPVAWAYAPPAEAPAPTPPPCLASRQVTFGSFNNFSKVTDEMLALWAELLRRVPDSRVLVKSMELGTPPVAAEIRGRLDRLGLPRERVELAGVTPTLGEHLGAYARVDVSLDTHPYNGTTTTCEALWMGVPVVSLVGDRHASRVGGSLLHAIGHPEWTATTPAEYVRVAASLVSEPSRLAAWRSALRCEMQHSLLMDFDGQSARFGAALRGCWQNWCRDH